MAEKQQEKSGWLCTWDLARFLEFLPCSLRLGRLQTRTVLGKEPTAHRVLFPVPAACTWNSENLHYPSEPVMAASLFSDNNIFQLTFSQASVFILYGF